MCAFGERLSSRIMQLALARERCPSEVADASNLIMTDARYLEATVDFPSSKRLFRSVLRPMLRRGIVPVLQGFMGAESSGHTTLLGRGGSDYSASIAGICLHADAVEIWTDVDGIMSADPRLVKRGVRTWKSVELAVMSEMAHGGAKVLHPKTVTAAVQQNIPVIVKNTFRPSAPGTVLVSTKSARPQLKGIVTQPGQMLFHFTEPGMLASSGFIQRVSGVFARHGIPMDVCVTSEISFTCSIAVKDYRAGILRELEEIADVMVRRNMAKVCVIGNRITADLRILGRVTRALGTMPIYAVSVGSSSDNITLMMDERDARRALQTLHRSLFPS
ncbi:MAG: aspartate kinase [bacterium]